MIADRYRVLGVIGRGGMGEVLRARDERLDRDVALKALRPGLSGNSDLVERLVREAKALARLQHPNVLTVLDVVEDGDRILLVLEYVAGGSLADRLRYGPVPWAECVRMGGQVCAALSAAHRAEIVHRDIKPSNILLEPDGRVRVADFGIARGPGDALTRTGTVLGTPGYMAPEQGLGKRATALSDQYCLAAVLFEAVCGRAPFVTDDDSTPTALGVMHATLPVPDPRTHVPTVPAAAAHLIMRGLQKKPEDRFPDIEAFHAALRESLGVPAVTLVGDGAAPDETKASTTPATVASPRPDTPAPETVHAAPGRRRTPLIVAAIAGVVAVAGGAAVTWRMQQSAHPAKAAGETSTQPHVATTAGTTSTSKTSSPSAAVETVALDLAPAFIANDPIADGADRCFGEGWHGNGSAWMDFRGRRYPRDILQCGVHGTPTGATGTYRFRSAGLGLRAGVTIIAVAGRFIIDQSSGQRHAQVTWTVNLATRRLCTATATWGVEGTCRMAKPVVVAAGDQLTISQSVDRADSGGMWAGVIQPRVTVQRPVGTGPAPADPVPYSEPIPNGGTTPAPTSTSPAYVAAAAADAENLIALHFKQGDFSDGAEAELLYRQMWAAGDPLRGNAAFNAGVIRYAQHDCPAARSAFAQAVTLDTSDPKRSGIRQAALDAATAGCTDAINTFLPGVP